jgi:hypothetical protein
MTDFYGYEIQIGDKCILLRFNQLEQVTALDVDDYQGGRVEVCTSGGTKLIISHPDRLIDITAIKEEVRKQQFFNSLKALSVKPNDTIVASMIPQQISLTETRKLFDTVKAIFPNNEVAMVLGLDISVE